MPSKLVAVVYGLRMRRHRFAVFMAIAGIAALLQGCTSTSGTAAPGVTVLTTTVTSAVTIPQRASTVTVRPATRGVQIDGSPDDYNDRHHPIHQDRHRDCDQRAYGHADKRRPVRRQPVVQRLRTGRGRPGPRLPSDTRGMAARRQLGRHHSRVLRTMVSGSWPW